MPKAQLYCIVALVLVIAPVYAHASACPSVDSTWFTWIANGTVASYGYTMDGTTQNSKTVSSVGVIRFLGTSAQSSNAGSTIVGTVSGTEKQNVGGIVTTLSFGVSDSTFTIDTTDCTGTVTRKFTNGSVVIWQIAVVDGVKIIRYMDTRPTVKTGTLDLMQ